MTHVERYHRGLDSGGKESYQVSFKSSGLACDPLRYKWEFHKKRGPQDRPPNSTALTMTTLKNRTPKDHIHMRSIRILQTIISGIPLILGLGTRI